MQKSQLEDLPQRIFFPLCLIVSIIAFCSICAPLALAFKPQNWHASYIQITDPASQRFMQKALSAATKLFGKPKIAVHSLYLCSSQPINPNSNLKRGFQLTSIEDRDKGIFAIFLSRKPSEYAFHGQLAHEVGHLLNIDIYDPYMEGLCSVFAERFIKAEGLDWSGWQKSFDACEEPFCAGTYKMMKELNSKIVDRRFRTILQFAAPSGHGTMHIDIKAWLATLTPQERAEAIKIITKYADYVKKTMPEDERYVFMLPSGSQSLTTSADRS